MSYRKENDPAGAIRGDGEPTTPTNIALEANRPPRSDPPRQVRHRSHRIAPVMTRMDPLHRRSATISRSDGGRARRYRVPSRVERIRLRTRRQFGRTCWRTTASVLLAEAGAGKTMEMTEQAKRLAGEGRFAVFVPLESLDRQPIADLLSVADEERFKAWKADGRETAWFFLDAVDELKLTDGKLDRALLQLSKAIDGHGHRARAIISCRPGDWRSQLDLTTVRDKLPVPARPRTAPSPPPDEVFLEALRRESRETSDGHREEGGVPETGHRTNGSHAPDERQADHSLRGAVRGGRRGRVSLGRLPGARLGPSPGAPWIWTS